jgi:hypothetical protein
VAHLYVVGINLGVGRQPYLELGRIEIETFEKKKKKVFLITRIEA